MYVQSIGDKIKDAAGDAKDAVKGGAGNVKDAAGSAAKSVKNVGKDAGDKADNATGDAQKNVSILLLIFCSTVFCFSTKSALCKIPSVYALPS